MKANLILSNANVLTMDPSCPMAEWVAMGNKKFLGIGENAKFGELKDAHTIVLDCKKKTILPGFIDAHCHLHAFAESLINLNLDRSNVKSIHDIQAVIKNAFLHLPPGSWIRAAGYNEFHLVEKRHPSRWDVDQATLLHPVKLTHRSGHAHVLNSFALRLLNISKETPDPPSGMIDRELQTGKPTGLLYGMGEFLAKHVPPLEQRDLERGIKLANQKLLSHGITSLQDASPRNGIDRWRMYAQWKKGGFLKPRIGMMLGIEAIDELRNQGFSASMSESLLRWGAVKIIVHETTGQLSPSQEDLNQMVLKIHQSGLQAALHAVEESTIEASCSAVEFALQRSPRSDHRHRIEHCSVCPPPLAKRLAALGIMVVTQPSFIYYNGDRYLRTVPNGQRSYLYPLATLLKNGVQVASSSDCPIVPINPLIGVYAASSRMAETGEILSPEEKITALEALRMGTVYAARSNFEEKMKGSIIPGQFADLVVLSEDPTKVPTLEIRDIEVEMTILDGEVVWNKETSR